MKEVEKLTQLSKQLHEPLKLFLDEFQKLESKFDFDDPNANPELKYKYILSNKIASAFENIETYLGFLYSEVVTTGILMKNENNRYEVNGIELTTGSHIEVLLHDTSPVPYYFPTTIQYSSNLQHKKGDYFIKCLGPNTDIAGLQIRIKN